MSDLILPPKHTIIETIAVNCAATWYEIGRSQGLTSKHPNAREYAKANLERFIPKAVEICLEMIGPNSTLPEQAKMDIYDALMERHNDPTLTKYLPNIDVKKAIEFAEMAEKKKPIDVIIDKAVKSLRQDTKAINNSISSIDEVLKKDNSDGKENN